MNSVYHNIVNSQLEKIDNTLYYDLRDYFEDTLGNIDEIWIDLQDEIDYGKPKTIY